MKVLFGLPACRAVALAVSWVLAMGLEANGRGPFRIPG